VGSYSGEAHTTQAAHEGAKKSTTLLQADWPTDYQLALPKQPVPTRPRLPASCPWLRQVARLYLHNGSRAGMG